MLTHTRKLVAALAVIGLVLIQSAPLWAASFEIPFCLVAGGGEPNGPAYDYWMGRVEVSVAEYFAFLNDAEANAGNERGANMVFDSNTGDVGLVDGSYTDGIFDISDCDPVFTQAPHYDVSYDANQPAGSRYSYDPNEANYPIVGVSWVGAVKFCNWLTIDQGLGADKRCYTEGAGLLDWHPVTISASEWTSRDLTDAERQTLVTSYTGFRLPMDNVGTDSGWLDGRPNPYNEWYKAGAYHPNAPDSDRIGAHGETVPAGHWMYGYGSDSLDLTKGNFIVYDSNTPGGVDPKSIGLPVPVGSYAANNGNYYGIDDLSGNVYEWGQDYSNSISDPIRHTSRGKAYNGGEPAVTLRHYRRIYNGTHFVGFRAVQAGSYRIDIAKVHGELGDVEIEPNTTVHRPGTQAVLRAVPNSGETFSHWEGDLPVANTNDNPLTVVMDQDRNITATFKEQPPQTFSLTVTQTEHGEVSPESGTHVEGTLVELTATADDGWAFSGWTGDVAEADKTENPLSLVMDQDRSVTSIFNEPIPSPAPYFLTPTSVLLAGMISVAIIAAPRRRSRRAADTHIES